ncbi:MAG: hypothetical protein PHY47_00585 [Lachnospiraceae bacterium]|nr:hypothetical protein [Lachnospiraceae bacterium]
MATAKKKSGPSRASKEDMNKANPKVAPKGKTKDKLKEVTEKSAGFFSKAFQAFKNICIDVKDLSVGLAKKAGNIVKGFTEKEKVHKYAGNARALLAVIMLICSVWVGIQFVLSYLTVQQVGLIAAAGVVGTYGLYRVTMSETTREAVKPSVAEMLSPMAA